MAQIILIPGTPAIDIASSTSAVNDPCDMCIGYSGIIYVVEDGGSPLTLRALWIYDPGSAPGIQPDTVTGLTLGTSLTDALDALADNVRSFMSVNLDVHWGNGHVSPA